MRTPIVIVIVPALVLGAALIGYSQTPSSAIPNVSGVWGWGRCVDGSGFQCQIMERDDPRLTDRAVAFQKAFDEHASPKYDCAPMSLPHIYSDPYNFQIEQRADRVIFTYEKDDIVRTAWLEGHGHKRPALNQFFVHGYSTARYEGDRLVVETTRFTFDPAGLNSDFGMPTSTQKKVTERFWRDGESLMVEITTEDPFFLRTPWTYLNRSARVNVELSLPWDCDLTAARQSLFFTENKYPNDPEVVRLPEPREGQQ